MESIARDLDRAVEALRSGQLDDARAATINRRLLAMDRELVLLNFSAEGPFDQDLAVPIPPVPLLEPARRLAGMDAASSEARFLATELTRNRNKAMHHLRLAAQAGEAAAETIEQWAG